MRIVRGIVKSLYIGIICLVFAFLAVNEAKAVTSSTIILQGLVSGQQYDMSVYSHAGGSGGPNPLWWAYQITTTTDIELCSFDFWVMRPDTKDASYYPSKLIVSLINSPIRDINDESVIWTTLGEFDYGDFVANNFTTTTISFDTCIPLWIKSLANEYFIAFTTDALDGSARTSPYQIQGTYGAAAGLIANWNSKYFTDFLWEEYPVIGHPVELSMTIDLRGSAKPGYLDGFDTGEWVETNTSTEGGFFTYCENIELDAGWWSPLVWVVTYLTCPDPRVMENFTETVDSLKTRVPMGYLTILYDEVTNYETTTNDGLVLEFRPPHEGLATTTISLNDAYEDIPAELRSWLDIWILRIAWLALLIYLFIRGLFFFQKNAG